MIRIVFLICTSLSTLLCARVSMQYYQLESYQLDGYFRTLRRNWFRAFLPGLCVVVFGCLLLSVLTSIAFEDWLVSLGLLAMTAASAFAYFLQRRLPAKRPLVVTPRVKRLTGMLATVILGLCAVILYAIKSLSLPLLMPLAVPLLLALAALLMLPLECYINYLYRRDAMKRLDAMPELIKIGITGSYGKTSAKFMLETILSEKYRVLATPGSFNTSMGVTRVIREQLAPDHQVFVAEMGARHRRDIRLLCQLVRPQYGIITSIGPQHLETFHTQETIYMEKTDLARSIPANGAMVFAADGGLCERAYQEAACSKHLAGASAEGLGLQAKDIHVGPFGSLFTLTDGSQEIHCETRLLGAHNITNLLVACTLARVLGMDLDRIARGVAKVRPVEHRLQLLDAKGGVTVIDDAFNANPVGANAALDTLKDFSGRRIVVTPGFVELGLEEAKFNREFGEKIAESVDIAVLVGKHHTEPIADGIKAKGFPLDQLYVVSSLEESSALLAGILRPGDVVLYENDLPDNYQE